MERIAIVGTGVSAMSAAYFLRNDFDITFFEKDNYAGGHTNTLTIDEEGTPIHIDSAFMVFNHVTYPNLQKFFRELEIEEKNTNMSFSVQHLPSGLEYCGTGLNGLFAQRKNLARWKHISMLLDINRFNKEAIEVLTDHKFAGYSIKHYFQEKGYGQAMLEKYLIPMSSAVWSTPPEQMLDFPILTLVRFFKNHGFLGMTTQHQWKTLVGGSRQYRDKVMAMFPNRVHLNAEVEQVFRKPEGVEVCIKDGERHMFDKVIIASHADQSLRLLGDPTEQEQNLLSKFKYQPNQATLHTDDSLMPKTRLAWSAWNYRIKAKANRLIPQTIYYMNRLQHVSQKGDYFVSINDDGDVHPDKIIWQKEYAHPLFDVAAIRAQDDLPKLNEQGRTYFCGAYFKYGFHEDGFTSGLNVAEKILNREVW